MASVGRLQALGWCVALPAPPPPILDGRLVDLFRRRMNCALVLSEPVLTPDGSGGSTRTWAMRFKTIGAVEGLTGMEKETEGGPDVAVTHRILVPFQAGIKPTMRVFYGARFFDVHTVVDYSEQHLLVELMCEEKFAG